MKKYIITTLVLMLVVVVIIVASFFYLVSPTDKNNYSSVYFEVIKGDSASSIGRRLKNDNLVKNSELFVILAKYFKYDRRLLTGFYEVSESMNTLEILRYINEGRQVLISFTIPEGRNIYDIANYLDSRELADKDEFLKLSHSKEMLEKYDIPASSIEGYLFPSTYYIVKGIDTKTIIETMINTLFEVYPKEQLEKRANELGVTMHELLTMASLVEKEMGPNDEPTLISSVYYNRLAIDMRLQADPTTVYAMVLEKGDSIEKPNIKRNDLLMSHPYNTYRVWGLPPGPIASSGEKAIDAAMFPTKTDYLFFVADGTGKHAFSKDYEQHLRYIDKYILGR